MFPPWRVLGMLILAVGLVVGSTLVWGPLAMWLVSVFGTSITTAGTIVMTSSLLFMFCGAYLVMSD